MKGIYTVSKDLQSLNDEENSFAPPNSRVQVLPVCWRHLLDFPGAALRANRLDASLSPKDDGSHGFDLGIGSPEDDNSYPSLDEISVDGVPAVRSLITDLALDILLYQSAYKEHIARIVVRESNRIYELFKKRNPNFNGKVSFVGHSLGSAILFDILCREGIDGKAIAGGLHFKAHDLYCLGSPIGLFQMLMGKMVAAHPSSRTFSEQVSNISQRFLSNTSEEYHQKEQFDHNLISAPYCSQIFNIFHPTGVL